jgi:hypothetical protein
MAPAQQPPGEGNFVSRLVDNPAKPPNLRVLCGFRGPALDEAHDRLYLDIALRTYVDVRKDEIRHREVVSQGPVQWDLWWVDDVATTAPASGLARLFAGAAPPAAPGVWGQTRFIQCAAAAQAPHAAVQTAYYTCFISYCPCYSQNCYTVMCGYTNYCSSDCGSLFCGSWGFC